MYNYCGVGYGTDCIFLMTIRFLSILVSLFEVKALDSSNKGVSRDWYKGYRGQNCEVTI